MSSSLESRELLEDFAEEALSALRELAPQLAAFRAHPHDDSPIHAVFRVVHSLKGNASFFGFTAIKQFAHIVENALDDIRKRKRELSPELERVLVDAFDQLDVQVSAALEGNSCLELSAVQEQILDRIAQLEATVAAPAAGESPSLLAELRQLSELMAQSESEEAAVWSQQLLAILDAQANDGGSAVPGQPCGRAKPQSFVGQALRTGKTDWTQQTDRLLAPFLAFSEGKLDDVTCRKFLDDAIALADEARRTDDEPLATAITLAAADFQKIFDSPIDFDENLLSLVWDHLEPELSRLKAAMPLPATEPTAAPAQKSNASEAPSAPPAGDTNHADAQSRARFVRVKEERLDEFRERVSGLFITCELLKDLHARMCGDKATASLVEELRQINQTMASQTSLLQQSVVSLQQVAVAALFSKFPRMARTLATQLGKQIDVQLSGEEIEIDKSLLEDLDAPLTHMIRNVVDHGIEPPDERQRRGVQPVGTMHLRAVKSRTHVSIIVEDDGRGIDPAKLRSKCVAKGLLTQAQADVMSDQEATELIFMPGFSTAEQVSEVSGRGVGLDVVRTKIREHSGDVTVTSKLGAGTTFRLDIPLRQAVMVIDGLLVRHHDQAFVIPFEHVREIAELDPQALTSVQQSRIARIRGELYDAVSLSRILDLAANADDAHPTGVVVGTKQGSFCLLVDAVTGHRQVVVNAIANVLSGLDNLAGVAQLGGGRLALVLSVPEMLRALETTAAQV